MYRERSEDNIKKYKKKEYKKHGYKTQSRCRSSLNHELNRLTGVSASGLKLGFKKIKNSPRPD
jgi:hypothetical protein